jgi:hypothetical protein
MSTITDLETSSTGAASKTIINDNFDNLNDDKVEKSGSTLTGAMLWSQTDSFGLKIQSLTTAQRNNLTPANGHIIYNTTTTQFEIYEAGVWQSLRASAVNASTTVKGLTKLSTAPASATDPIAVGDNDVRIPSTDENDALAGTSGTPSSSNKYVTSDDVASAKTASKIARRDANSDVLVATTPTDGDAATSKTYVDGLIATTAKLKDSNLADVTVASSTSETDLLSYTVPANLLGTGNILEFKLFVSDFAISDTKTATFKLKYGGTTIATITYTQPNGVNVTRLKLNGAVYASGASAQEGSIEAIASQNNLQVGANNCMGMDTQVGTAAEDSTGALDLKVTVQFNNNSASDKITVANSYVKLLA